MTALMIEFSAVRAPLSATLPGSEDRPTSVQIAEETAPSDQYFIPVGVLHPRFSLPKSGSGHWVVCWNKAIDLVATKGTSPRPLVRRRTELMRTGSYKRFCPTATMPPHLESKITSELARRIVAEFEIFCQKVKTRTAFLDAEKTIPVPCPVVQLREDQLAGFARGSLEVLEREGMQLCAVMSFEVGEVQEGDTELPVSLLIPHSGPNGEADVPLYNLANIFRNVKLPPSEAPTPTRRTTKLDPVTSLPIVALPRTGLDLLDEIQYKLNLVTKLFELRAGRNALLTPSPDTAPSATATAPVAPRSKIYAIYSPLRFDSPRQSEQQTEPASDAVHLLLAMWRFRLWTGEGWGEEVKEKVLRAGRKKGR